MNSMSHTRHHLLPMRAVTRLTGLPANTIRVWERRYQAVTPLRTEGNARRYTQDDVRRLRLLKAATEAGHRIGDVARLSGDELAALDGQPKAAAHSLADVQRTYLDAIRDFDSRGASRILARTAALLDPGTLAMEVVLPVLRTVGEQWVAGKLSVAHEHLVTVQMRGLLDTLLRLSDPLPGSPRVVVATPPGHRHEFGALVGAQLAIARGFDPLYLGVDVPFADLEQAFRVSGAAVCLLALARDVADSEQGELLDGLARLADVGELWVGLPPSHGLIEAVPRVRFFTRFEDLDAALVERATRARA